MPFPLACFVANGRLEFTRKFRSAATGVSKALTSGRFSSQQEHIRLLDRFHEILFMKDGRIVERGSPSDLIGSR